MPHTCGAHIGVVLRGSFLTPPRPLSGLRTIWVTGAPPAYPNSVRPSVCFYCSFAFQRWRLANSGARKTRLYYVDGDGDGDDDTTKDRRQTWSVYEATRENERKQIRCRWTRRGPSSWWRRRCWCISCRRVRSTVRKGRENDYISTPIPFRFLVIIITFFISFLVSSLRLNTPRFTASIRNVSDRCRRRFARDYYKHFFVHKTPL